MKLSEGTKALKAIHINATRIPTCHYSFKGTRKGIGGEDTEEKNVSKVCNNLFSLLSCSQPLVSLK